jgi:hypothetical protein
MVQARRGDTPPPGKRQQPSINTGSFRDRRRRQEPLGQRARFAFGATGRRPHTDAGRAGLPCLEGTFRVSPFHALTIQSQPEAEFLQLSAARLRAEYQQLVEDVLGHGRPEPPPFPDEAERP